MTGQQRPLPTGFPNAQQNPIRNQFSGGQMIAGPMNPQQGMPSSQQFRSEAQAGVNPNPKALGALNAQQVMAKQQSMQRQQQIQQQVLLQQQQQQQQQTALAQQNKQIFVTPAAPQMPAPQSQPPVTRPCSRDLNTAVLCKSGQDHVQEILSRTQEAFQMLKIIQPPNGNSQGQNLCVERKKRVQELVKTTTELFKRLRYIYEKCNENCQLQGMEYTYIESLIPVREEWDMKSADEKKASDAYKLACEELKEIKEQVVLKNKQLKEIIDHLRRIVSEVNTMMNMRRS